MQISASDVVSFLSDRLLSYELGEEAAAIGFSPVQPGLEGHVSFATATAFPALNVAAVSASDFFIVDPNIDLQNADGRSVFVVEDPRREFIRLMRHVLPMETRFGIHPTASVHPDAVVGSGCWIGPGVVISQGVSMGDECQIAPNCVIGPNTRIGHRVKLGPGVVIGEEGFGYVREPDGTPILMPHCGGVVIGDDVEIGANSVIDRGAMTDTVIGACAKIDNLVHIAHNVSVGWGALVIGSASVSGSVRLGDRSWIAPNSTIAEHTTVGDDAKVGLSAVVLRDVPSAAVVFGNPARVVSRGDGADNVPASGTRHGSNG